MKKLTDFVYDWMPWPLYCLVMNFKIRKLVRQFPDNFVITGMEDGLLQYEHTVWWARRRELFSGEW